MTKSPLIVAVSTTLMLSSAAFAATGEFGKIDTNADGKITLEEGMNQAAGKPTSLADRKANGGNGKERRSPPTAS